MRRGDCFRAEPRWIPVEGLKEPKWLPSEHKCSSGNLLNAGIVNRCSKQNNTSEWVGTHCLRLQRLQKTNPFLESIEVEGLEGLLADQLLQTLLVANSLGCFKGWD